MQAECYKAENSNAYDQNSEYDTQNFLSVFLVGKWVDGNDNAAERNGCKFGKLSSERDIDSRADIYRPTVCFKNRSNTALTQFYRG